MTPGQSAVIYDRDECLGGSFIRERNFTRLYNWATNRGIITKSMDESS
ncbi:MAG: hypothetical protein CM15mP12_0410 [Gammaproteobacteria bacterium]|nr:MAG: hypothetical protein CM15mP12_0410 [Gammaproteobacteria bacterium]